MKTTREWMNIIDAFRQLGSYRAAARVCGTTDKTVKRAIRRQQLAGPWTRRPRLSSKNTDAVMAIIWERIRGTDGRISAKRLLSCSGPLLYVHLPDQPVEGLQRCQENYGRNDEHDQDK